jgi:N-acyl-L-homoserine lactone synthetase
MVNTQVDGVPRTGAPRTTIHCVITTARAADPRLIDSMYRDRAAVFRDRLGWDLTVDDRGWECDEYDALNPLYCIAALPDGTHGGSLRLLPTTGRTMLHDHFAALLGPAEVRSPTIWEVTRLCVTPRATPWTSLVRLSSLVMHAAAEFGMRAGVTQFVGVYAAAMTAVYHRCGQVPRCIGKQQRGEEEICAGLWTLDARACASLLAASQRTPDAPLYAAAG